MHLGAKRAAQRKSCRSGEQTDIRVFERRPLFCPAVGRKRRADGRFRLQLDIVDLDLHEPFGSSKQCLRDYILFVVRLAAKLYVLRIRKLKAIGFCVYYRCKKLFLNSVQSYLPCARVPRHQFRVIKISGLLNALHHYNFDFLKLRTSFYQQKVLGARSDEWLNVVV